VYLGDETLLSESFQLKQDARTAGVDARVEVHAGQQRTFRMAAGRAP
jgi:hypothetical protein